MNHQDRSTVASEDGKKVQVKENSRSMKSLLTIEKNKTPTKYGTKAELPRKHYITLLKAKCCLCLVSQLSFLYSISQETKSNCGQEVLQIL